MNKNDLVDSLAEEFELTKSYARDLVDSMFQRIIDAAEAVKIAPRKVLKFEAAKAMKESLNTKKRGRKKAA